MFYISIASPCEKHLRNMREHFILPPTSKAGALGSFWLAVLMPGELHPFRRCDCGILENGQHKSALSLLHRLTKKRSSQASRLLHKQEGLSVDLTTNASKMSQVPQPTSHGEQASFEWKIARQATPLSIGPLTLCQKYLLTQ